MVAAASRRDAMLVTGTAAIAAALAAPPVLPVLAEGVAALEPMEALKGKDYGKPRITCVRVRCSMSEPAGAAQAQEAAAAHPHGHTQYMPHTSLSQSQQLQLF
jgi:hypothetical protein